MGSPDGFNAINTLLADAKPPNSHLAASIETLETAPGCPPIPARGSEMVAPSKKNSRDELMTTVCVNPLLFRHRNTGTGKTPCK